MLFSKWVLTAACFQMLKGTLEGLDMMEKKKSPLNWAPSIPVRRLSGQPCEGNHLYLIRKLSAVILKQGASFWVCENHFAELPRETASRG